MVWFVLSFCWVDLCNAVVHSNSLPTQPTRRSSALVSTRYEWLDHNTTTSLSHAWAIGDTALLTILIGSGVCNLNNLCAGCDEGTAAHVAARAGEQGEFWVCGLLVVCLFVCVYTCSCVRVCRFVVALCVWGCVIVLPVRCS